MICKAADLSSDQKAVIEGLLGRPVSSDEAISVRATVPLAAPVWLQQSWDSAGQLGLAQLSSDEIDAEIDAVRKSRRTRNQPTAQ